MLDKVIPARDLGIEAVRQAWQFDPDDPFGTGKSIVPETRLPRGEALIPKVPRAFDGGRSVEETMPIVFVGYFPWTEGSDVDAEKVAKGKVAGEALVAANWRDLGCYSPQVDSVDFEDIEADEPFYIVAISFSVKTDCYQ